VRLPGRRRVPSLFVLGVQKSGTTAIASLLAKLTGRTLSSDFTHLDPPAERTRFFDRDLPFDEFVAGHRAELGRDIVKDPNLSFFVAELRVAFPASRVVFISRDPREQIRSLLDWMELPGDRDELDAEPLAENMRMLLEGRWPRVEGRNYVDRLAARWRLAADAYLAHREQVELIRYEDFVRDKAGELAALARRVGLEPVNDVGGEVDTQFQPRGRPRPWPEVYGLRNLRLIEEACAAQMAALGYARSS
jgi:hypothetical protein